MTCSKCKRDSPASAMRHKTDARGNWTVALCPSCNDDYLRVVDQDRSRDYIDRLKTFLKEKP